MVLRDAPDAMLIVASDGSIQYANRQAEVMFGRAADDLVGSGIEALVPAQLRAQHRAHRASFSAHPSLRSMGEGLPLVAARADGSVLPVEISLAPLDVEGGGLTLAAVRDVSRQRAAARDLRSSEERFRRTFHSSPVGLALIAPDGRLGLVNKALVQLSGCAESALLDMTLGQLLPSCRPDTAGLAPDRSEHRLVRADGETRWVEVTLSRLDEPGDGATHVVAHFYDLTERHSHQEQLQALALSDPLTGLPNWVLLLDRLEQALSALGRRPGRVALLLLDLDHFKDVNDTLGHPVGDMLLRDVAQRLSSVARSTDTVARLGGDEFALLCTDLPSGEVEFAQRLLQALEPDHKVPAEDGTVRRVRLGASIGIAVAERSGTFSTDLYRDADLALYEAKARGRGRARVFDQSLRERLQQEVTGEEQLRQALRGGGIRVALQPLVDLGTGRVIAHEALARIQSPDGGGLLGPDQVLPAAHDRGLFPALDLAVLDVCLDRLRKSDDNLHVNVSGASLDDGAWQKHLLSALAREPEIASRLSIELTEQTLMTTADASLAAIEQLRLRGVRVGLDDFGTGYSSLSYLERLPLDFLKLDTTLVARITLSHAARTLVESIITLGTRLGLQVVAEGVELAQQAELLRGWGCQVGQGYLFGRPECVDPVVAEQS